MAAKHTLEELITMILMMQGQLDALNENIEKLIEQVRIANSYRFGKHTETLDSIDGQLSFFDEAESCCDLSAPEPAEEERLYLFCFQKYCWLSFRKALPSLKSNNQQAFFFSALAQNPSFLRISILPKVIY